MHDTIPETCDKCGCTPTVDPETDVIDLIQVCGISLGVQLDREHWLCSTCAAEFGGGTDGDECTPAKVQPCPCGSWEEHEVWTRGGAPKMVKTQQALISEDGTLCCLECGAAIMAATQDTSWALDRLSILVTALQCYAGGEHPREVYPFSSLPRPVTQSGRISGRLGRREVRYLLDALGLTEEQQEALDNR